MPGSTKASDRLEERLLAARRDDDLGRDRTSAIVVLEFRGDRFAQGRDAGLAT